MEKAKAFCKQFSQPPDLVLFGRDRYKQVLRPWFEAFATAQQRPKECAFGDLQFSDSKREETEQEQAIKSSQVAQLNRLIKHSDFPKALFFIQAKTLQNVESLYLHEEILHSCPAGDTVLEAVCFSPDGRNLLIAFGNTVRFLVFDRNGNVIRQYDKSYSSDVKEFRFSPDSCSLFVRYAGRYGDSDSITIMGLDGDDWVQKGETKCKSLIYSAYSQPVCEDGFEDSICFSPNSNSLATTVKDYYVLIMCRDEEGNWVQNSRIPFDRAEGVCFSPNGNNLAIWDSSAVWIEGCDEEGKWVPRSVIPCNRLLEVTKVYFSPDSGSFVIMGFRAVLFMRSDGKGKWVKNFVIRHALLTSVCFSPDGGSLAISGSRDLRKSVLTRDLRKSVLVMRSDGKGNWVQNFVIPCYHFCTAHFSPDGRSLIIRISTNIECTPHPSPPCSRIIDLGRANSSVCKHGPFLHSGWAFCFSPCGGGWAMGCGNTALIMGLNNKGNWVEKARIPNEGNVVYVCFSPDGRRLAITSAVKNAPDGPRFVSHIKICEIKTGKKALTDLDI